MDYIISSGDVESGIMLYKNDSMTVLDGGIASETAVNQNGSMSVSSGGTAKNTTVNSSGCVYVSTGGSAINTTVAPNGGLYIKSNGIANGIQVNEGGRLFVSSGGTALNIVENGGYVMVGKETNATFVSNTFSNIDIRNGSVTIHSGTTANNTTIDMSNGCLYVYSGGIVNDTTVNDGYLRISSGGSAIDILINHKGNIFVSSGGRLSGRMICLHGKIYASNAFLDFDLTQSLPGDAALLNDFSCVSGFPFYTITVNADQAEGIYFLAENAGAFNGTISVANTTGEYLGTLVLGETITISDITYTLSLSDDMLSLKIGENNTPSPYTSNGLIISGNTAEKTIESGEVYLNTLIVSSGTLKIFSGGIADRTLVKNSNGLNVFSGGTANRTTINDLGGMTVASGGTAINTTVSSSGRLYVTSGGTALNITESGGYVEIADDADVSFTSNVFSGLLNDAATVHSGTTANSVIVDGSGKLFIYSGGKAENTELYGGYGGTASLFVCSGGTANNTTATNGHLYVSSGGIANNTTVISGGNMLVSPGGVANSTTINTNGFLAVSSGGMMNTITVNIGGKLYVISGGTVNSATVSSRGSMFVSSGGKMTGEMIFEEGAVVSAEEGAILDFDISGLTAEAGARVNNLAIIQGTPVYTLTVSAEQAKGVYTLAEGAAGFNSTITVQNTLGETLGTLTAGETLKVGYNSYTLNRTEDVLSVTVVPYLTPQKPVGTSDKVSWEATGAERYIVEYSTDNFEHVVSVVTTGNAIDMPDLPAGNYQWRVKADGGEEWAVGESIDVSDAEASPAPKVVQSNDDGNDDLFFASPNGIWSSLYYAQHVGSINDWAGTNEMVSANGKGRIRNLFFGSADPNVLCLSDGENGDAIFVDDVYTDLPDEVETQTARLYRILEIRAGAGDDIVDMTSQRFEYVGEGLRIHGGNGNDTIWANKGDNFLFGDAGNDRIVGASGDDLIAGGIGNDRMHGGGGEDVFTFSDNWGADTVEQLADGFVTLWFASGSETNWNADTLTYIDGENSVTVSGVTADRITLKFGDDGSDQFAALSAIGAFLDFTSERIFEESHIV